MVQLTKMNMRNIAVICSAAVLMLIGSTMAYFSSSDRTTNRLTAWWHFDIVLTEEHWNPEDGIYVLPGDIIEKDPRIVNNGISAYVFLRVSVPCASPASEYETGTNQGKIERAANAEPLMPLYKFVTNGIHASAYNDFQMVHTSCWKLLYDFPALKDGYYIYTYAYTDVKGNLRPLDNGETTEYPLFDAIKLCNFNETYDGTEKSILVEALGIQSDNLEITDPTPENVWTLLKNRG